MKDTMTDTPTEKRDSDGPGGKFLLLYQFCSDLLKMFPGTATVEPDFSVLGWEKNACTYVSHISLQGTMYHKQLNQLII